MLARKTGTGMEPDGDLPGSKNPKEHVVELIINHEIKNVLDAVPEPFHTYLARVKKWRAVHPSGDPSRFQAPKGVSNDINEAKMKLSQLKIGGLKEVYGFSSGVKFSMAAVIQAIASGKGLTSKDRPFIKVKSDITHSVTILVDFSASMAQHVDKVKESVFVVSEVLSKMQLSFCVLGFSENLWIIKDFSEKWDLESRARLYNLAASGMSPAGPAISVAGAITQKAIEKGKVMFVITDGLFDDPVQVKLAVQSVRKKDIIIVGISIFANIGDVFPIVIHRPDNLNGLWSTDALMRIYSREFQSDH